MTEKDVKSCFSVKKLILTRERHAEHQFAGQIHNTHTLTIIHFLYTQGGLVKKFDAGRRKKGRQKMTRLLSPPLHIYLRRLDPIKPVYLYLFHISTN